ncbi:MAG: endolytic transglycosylase MltG [Aestuariivita sp.]|nr:endolytic transglycosylase MltG [Aestuariivita sp.]
MAKAIAANGLTFLIVFLFFVGSVILWIRAQYQNDGPLTEAICLVVERGSTMDRVGQFLNAQGAISSELIFRLGADYSGKTNQLKAGSFIVEPNASMQRIVADITGSGASSCSTEVVYRIGISQLVVEIRQLDLLDRQYQILARINLPNEEIPETLLNQQTKPGVRFRIALAEGVTSWQVAESLKQIDILTGDIPELPQEGSLAPASYDVIRGDDRRILLTQIQNEQMSRIVDAWQKRSKDSPLSTQEDMVNLASIIEKEAGLSKERKKIASVFVNRLLRGMRLQSDPTVIYGITQGKGVLGRGLRRSELNEKTPWNTYRVDGLPLTPISNPSLESLIAAVNPDDTTYFYFVADGTGGHAFSETLDEHNQNVARWRQIEAERKKVNN